MTDYDPQNIFAKILRKEIPCQKVFEDEQVLAFNDIAPQAPVHILVIPKGPYRNYEHFCQQAPSSEIAIFFKRVGEIASQAGLSRDGYRLITNSGLHGGQLVNHFHVHILGGHPLPR